MAAIDFSKVLDESSQLLVDGTPSESAMEGYSARVKDKYLKGLGYTQDNTNLRDSKAFIEGVMANVASADGIKATAADVKRWSTMTFDAVAKESPMLQELVKGTAAASAQVGLDVASSVYGESFQFFSLGSKALEDGKITAKEAIQLGASAASFSSTMLAGMSVGSAFGPMGAVAGLVMGGVSYLSSDSAAYKAYWDAREVRAARIADSEKRDVDAFLEKQYVEYDKGSDLLWQSKDTSVAEVADSWAGFESQLGVRFGLRYFPGSTTPPRGGVYRHTLIQGSSRTWVKSKQMAVDVPGGHQKSLPLECGSLSGCLYFPEPLPNRVKALGYAKAYVEMLENMDEAGSWLTTDDAKYLNTEKDFVHPRREAGYDYYHKTLRAFDAFLVNKSDKEAKHYWEPPGRRKHPDWKSYLDLSYDRVCKLRLAVTSNRKCPAVYKMPYSVAQQNDGFEAVKSWYKYKPNESSGMSKLAYDYVRQQFEALANEASQVDVMKTRIMGDLIQTSNAVGAEMVTAVRMKSILKEVVKFEDVAAAIKGRVQAVNKLFGRGESDSDIATKALTKMSGRELSSFTALDAATTERIKSQKARGDLINNGMLLVGASAAGFGAYKKWSR